MTLFTAPLVATSITDTLASLAGSMKLHLELYDSVTDERLVKAMGRDTEQRFSSIPVSDPVDSGADMNG